MKVQLWHNVITVTLWFLDLTANKDNQIGLLNRNLIAIASDSYMDKSAALTHRNHSDIVISWSNCQQGKPERYINKKVLSHLFKQLNGWKWNFDTALSQWQCDFFILWPKEEHVGVTSVISQKIFILNKLGTVTCVIHVTCVISS